MVTGVFGAPTRVRTTLEAEVIRADGRREQLGVIAESERPLSLFERMRRMVRPDEQPNQRPD